MLIVANQVLFIQAYLNSILNKQREIKIYPVLIKQKVLVRNPGWEKHEQILEDFIYKNKYEKVWDNKKFEILISNSHYLNE